MTIDRLRARTREFRDSILGQWRHDHPHIDTANQLERGGSIGQAATYAGKQTQVTSGGLRRCDREEPSHMLQRAADAAGMARADAASGRAALYPRSCSACPFIRAELGCRLTFGARDHDERMQAGQRADAEHPPFSAPWRHRLRAAGIAPAACELGALALSRRGDPRADAQRR